MVKSPGLWVSLTGLLQLWGAWSGVYRPAQRHHCCHTDPLPAWTGKLHVGWCLKNGGEPSWCAHPVRCGKGPLAVTAGWQHDSSVGAGSRRPPRGGRWKARQWSLSAGSEQLHPPWKAGHWELQVKQGSLNMSSTLLRLADISKPSYPSILCSGRLELVMILL